MTKAQREVAIRLEKISIFRRIELNKLSTRAGLYLGQLPILEYIIRNDGCTQQEIAKVLNVTPASIATSTKRLQKSGLVMKKTDESNLRQNVLSVTQKGLDLSQKCRENFNEFDKTFFKGFTDQDLEKIKQDLDRLIANIAGENEITTDWFSLEALKQKSKKMTR